jgi:hypothetical protein
MSIRTFELYGNMPTEGKIAFSMPSDCPQILTVKLYTSRLETPQIRLKSYDHKKLLKGKKLKEIIMALHTSHVIMVELDCTL